MQTPSYYDRAAARPSRPASIAPSISSVLSDATTINAPVHVQRGFKTREAYLEALNDFAESKLYMPAGQYTLHGWYGGETMEDRKKRLGVGREKKKRSKGAKSSSNTINNGRRETIAVVPEASEEPGDAAAASTAEQVGAGHESTSNAERGQSQSRLRRLSRAFSGGKERRATVV